MLLQLEEYMDTMGYPRTHFSSLMGTQARVLHQEHMTGATQPSVIERAGGSVDQKFVVYSNNQVLFPYVIRIKPYAVQPFQVRVIESYPRTYLLNSILNNILFGSYPETDVLTDVDVIRMKTAVWMLYYYFFYYYWRDADINAVTERVKFGISDLIKTIINRNETKYRNINTDNIIDGLRVRLNMETASLQVRGTGFDMRAYS